MRVHGSVLDGPAVILVATISGPARRVPVGEDVVEHELVPLEVAGLVAERDQVPVDTKIGVGEIGRSRRGAVGGCELPQARDQGRTAQGHARPAPAVLRR